jgi:hypothetical protein
MNTVRRLKENFSAVVSRKGTLAYILKPEDLNQSKNLFIKERLIEKDFTWEADKTTEGKPIGHQLHADFARDVRINGKGPKAFPNRKKNLEAFKKFVEKELGKDHAEAAMSHYSQLGIIAAGPLALASADKELTIAQPNHSLLNLYVKEGAVYFKVRVESYPVKMLSEGNEPIGYLPGPVEAIFKLDKEKGFVLQHISTNSEIVRDLMMGVEVAQQKIANESNATWRKGMKKIEVALDQRETQLDGWFKKHNVHAVDAFGDDPEIRRKNANKGRIATAKSVIQQYKAGTLTDAEAHTRLSELLLPENTPSKHRTTKIGQFFSAHASSTTTTVLKKALADFEQATGYKPQASKVEKIPTLKRG